VPRKQGASIHVVLPKPIRNDDVADFASGLSRSRDASEEDFVDAEIGNQMRCRGGRSNFAPSRKDHNHWHIPKATRVIGSSPIIDNSSVWGKRLQERLDFLVHGSHDSNGHRDSVAA
jgi:hypothetical protein